MRTVAALYVDRLGPYAAMSGVDPWFIDGRRDEQARLGFEERFHFHRDATAYDGPHPVVAHPPCGPWGRLRHLCKKDDPALALRAVEQVRRFGGVLEHPADSRLWEACSLPKPGAACDAFGAWTIRINQVDWGHQCIKPTWLYLVGIAEAATSQRPPAGQPTHGIWYGDFERSGHAGPKLKAASKEIRRRTPPAFAEWLVTLARASSVRAEERSA